MKKIMMIVIMLMIGSGCFAYEHDPWTTQDTVLQGGVTAILIIDYWQTYTFLYTGDYKAKGYYETNSSMGPYPSKKRFFTLATIGIIGNMTISYLIPFKFLRTIWQSVWFGIEWEGVYHNYKSGVIIHF